MYAYRKLNLVVNRTFFAVEKVRKTGSQSAKGKIVLFQGAKKYDCSLKPLGKQNTPAAPACFIKAAFDTLLRNYCHTILDLAV